MGLHKANQTSFKKGQKPIAPFAKGHIPWNKGLVGVQAGERGANWRGGIPNCKECGRQLSQRHSKTNQCQKCFLEDPTNKKQAIRRLSKIDNTGEKNWNWKGGITSKDRMERVKFRKTLQKLIFERDGYKCQICEANQDLQVDHIASWAEFKELRFDPENCRTLCTKCHYKITFKREMPESIKGWGHNFLKGGY